MLRRQTAVLVMLVGLPALPYYLWICLTYFGGALVWPASPAEAVRMLAYVPGPTLTAFFLYAFWLLLQIALQMAAPGDTRRGTPLADGSRLGYRMNGWFSFWCTWAVLGVLVWSGWLSPTIAYDQFGPLLTTANIAAFLLAAGLYLSGTRWRDSAATGLPAFANASAGRLYDYVMGLSLNPRIRTFDLKLFCESRPGLILWLAINASLAAKQYELYGYITTPMILVNVFQFLYVADCFFFEEALLTTWDIKHERFGWMLCWGNLVWVPFVYSIQAYYLVTHAHDLPLVATIGIVALNAVGYLIFRSANIQKHRFRRDPARHVWGRPPEFIRTGSGALLLTSGCWGIARHLNYLGDLMMGLAWCLPTGFEHPLPYFYIVYFVILLIHRERRDHAMCLRKYGRDWDAYCQRVPWRILPGVY